MADCYAYPTIDIVIPIAAMPSRSYGGGGEHD